MDYLILNCSLHIHYINENEIGGFMKCQTYQVIPYYLVEVMRRSGERTL
jgi:hypothetical protein